MTSSCRICKQYTLSSAQTMQVLCYRPERTDTDGGTALSLVVVGLGCNGSDAIHFMSPSLTKCGWDSMPYISERLFSAVLGTVVGCAKNRRA